NWQEAEFMVDAMARLWRIIASIRLRLYLGILVTVGSFVVYLLVPQLLETLFYVLDTSPPAATVWIAGGVVIFLRLIEAVLLWLRRLFAIRPSTNIERQMRVRFYNLILEMPVAFFNDWGSGQLLSRAQQDVSQIRRWIAFGM